MSQRPYDIVFCHLQVFNIVRWEVGSTCWCFYLGVQLYPLTSPTHTPPGNLHSCFLYATSPSQQSLSIRCKVSWHLFSLPNSSISIASIFSSPIHSLAHSNPLPDLSTPGFQTSFFFFFRPPFIFDVIDHSFLLDSLFPSTSLEAPSQVHPFHWPFNV